MAKKGQIPSYYKAQLQHQMWVCGVESMFYYSFDGKEGVSIEVSRNTLQLDLLIEKEQIFYECLVNRDEEKIKRAF